MRWSSVFKKLKNYSHNFLPHKSATYLFVSYSTCSSLWLLLVNSLKYISIFNINKMKVNAFQFFLTSRKVKLLHNFFSIVFEFYFYIFTYDFDRKQIDEMALHFLVSRKISHSKLRICLEFARIKHLTFKKSNEMKFYFFNFMVFLNMKRN